MSKKFKYIKDWKFPGGYYEGDTYIRYTGMDDPKFIEAEEELIAKNLNGWWIYVDVASVHKPERFRDESRSKK